MKKILVLLILLSISLPIFAYDPNSPNLIWDAKAQKYKFNYNEIEFEYDNGKLVKIGDNIVKYYNSVNRIEFIGDMPVKYDSKGRIKQVGNKRIYYLSNGRIGFILDKWSYKSVEYAYASGNDGLYPILYRIGNYKVGYDSAGRIKYLVKY